ncbi:fluoride efflux transporter CrcB [uncultured Mailhella sp.]|uniref:fluoride efflux transporter CrcB n=1 Tax=uncultured Mailhella sp. TaxID=1981031 RepID=UPI0025FBF164|nr:fluoride efflux transporter CrcB [uncultured Mailhella sp.]
MTQLMKQTVAVLCGGALGAVCRVEAGRAVMNFMGVHFPLGILCVNMLGSFLLGLFLGAISRTKSGCPTAAAFVSTGFFGGFTTFSSFALDTLTLWESGSAMLALLNVGLNAALCIVLAGLGWTIAAPWREKEA